MSEGCNTYLLGSLVWMLQQNGAGLQQGCASVGTCNL